MPTILVIDDDPASRSLIVRKFEPMGYQVITAADGVQGVQIVESTPVDLILLDLHMPIQDGLTTLRMIRAVRPEAKVIIVTAYFDDAAFAAALPSTLANGVIEIIHKPVNIKELAASVTRVFNPAPPQPPN